MQTRFLTTTAAILFAVAAQADDLYLTNGGKVEGTLQNPNAKPGEGYVLVTSFGGKVTLGSDQVERIEARSKIEKRYAAMLPTVPDTEAGHLGLAEGCRKAGLDDRRRFHLEQVLRHNPENAEARHALGYSRIDGKWTRQDQWMEQQGYVRSGGKWRLPQELELTRVKDAHEQAVVGWRKKLKNWRSWIVKRRDRGKIGEAEIRAVRDPQAAVALVEMLENEKELHDLRVMYVEVLGQLAGNEGTAALTKHAIYNDNAKLREACLDQLERAKPASAVSTFIDGLKSKNNHIVNRSAIALSRMQNPTATLPLIDALVTEHKVVLQQGGGLQPTFSNAGSGFSAGSKREVKKIKQKNEPVLHTLVALHPGVNFGFNQLAWRNWYVVNKSPPPVHLRRDHH